LKTNLIEFTVETNSINIEAVIAWLGTVGFHAFEETQKGVKAYISPDLYEKDEAMKALSFLSEDQFRVSITEIAPKNWNEDWEASWQNVEIGDFCQVIPSFREPRPGFDYSLIVDPKMAFGTGHHETTKSVIELIRTSDLVGKKVLDMGCGTGILGILALKMGAREVFAIDIDPWSVENTLLNAQLNEVEHLEVIEGIAEDIPKETYEVIFANINKNVLLEDIPTYAKHLSPQGTLMLSGFYEQDEEEIRTLTEQQGLVFSEKKTENHWVAASFVKEIVMG